MGLHGTSTKRMGSTAGEGLVYAICVNVGVMGTTSSNWLGDGIKAMNIICVLESANSRRCLMYVGALGARLTGKSVIFGPGKILDALAFLHSATILAQLPKHFGRHGSQ